MSELDRYDYELPKHLIAQHPALRRSDARLMLVDRRQQSIDHYHVRDLPELLHPRDCLVLNETRVVPAQLVGVRETTGGRWQGLYLDSDELGNWRLLCKTRGKLAPGDRIVLLNRDAEPDLGLVMLARLEGGAWAARPDSPLPALTLLDRVGRVPLPHYIRGGKMETADLERYQTVYARQPGSVAAPTAGLHFTPELLRRIEARGIGIAKVTLHVGLGTFRPISVDRLDEHTMHSEWGRIDAETAQRLVEVRASGGRIVAVGTTSVRLLESAALSGELAAWSGETNLFIRPGFTFRAVDALMTNFHLPRSTLLVLVRTFGGDELMRRAYAEALAEEYRFFSYGDAMLIV